MCLWCSTENRHRELFCEISGAPNSTTSAEKRDCPVESGGTLGKLCALLRVNSFTWGIEEFCNFVKRANLEHFFKIRYTGKDLPIFPEY